MNEASSLLLFPAAGREFTQPSVHLIAQLCTADLQTDDDRASKQTIPNPKILTVDDEVGLFKLILLQKYDPGEGSLRCAAACLPITDLCWLGHCKTRRVTVL